MSLVALGGFLVLFASAGTAGAVEITSQPAPVQQAPSEPTLGFAFPAETREGKPMLTAALMVNDRMVIPAGTPVYTLYQIPRPDDEDTRAVQKRMDRKDAYSRTDHLRILEKETAAQVALRERALKTRWASDLPFRAMLNLHAGRDLFLVFAATDGQPAIEPVELPEGMLLCDRGQGAEVLWVASDGGGARAGFRRGDRIVSIAGKPVATLAQFQSEYRAQKASDARGRGLKVDVVPASGGGTVVRDLQAPASLMGSFLDMPPE